MIEALESVHPPGSEVFVCNGEMKATVICAAWYTEGLKYQVVWWKDGARNSDWVYSYEIQGEPSNLKPFAGFTTHMNGKTAKSP